MTPAFAAGLSQKQVTVLVRLLGKYQNHLEILIDQALAPGELYPRAETDKRPVMQARKDWNLAERLINEIAPAVKRRRK